MPAFATSVQLDKVSVQLQGWLQEQNGYQDNASLRVIPAGSMLTAALNVWQEVCSNTATEDNAHVHHVRWQCHLIVM